jgi:outer membrane protein assembly factor BamD
MRVSKLLPLFLIAVLLVVGCSRVKKEDETETLPVEKMYSEAKGSLENGNLDRAIRYYKRLTARFPFGPYTEQSQIELAYAQYKSHEPDDAYSTLNRFIKTYPTQAHVDYAYYLRGIVNFNREGGLLERYISQDMTKRDQGFFTQAFSDFSELLNKFPDSRYAEDARQRMIYLRNAMANAEINVAKYYLRRGAYVAASARSKYIVENFQRTPQAGDALAVLVESYKALGQDKLSADSERVLKLNYPDHPYFKGGWPERPAFWRRIVPFANKG